MLDVKLIRSNPESIALALKKKNYDFDFNEWNSLETSRKTLQLDTEKMQAELNAISKEMWHRYYANFLGIFRQLRYTKKKSPYI